MFSGFHGLLLIAKLTLFIKQSDLVSLNYPIAFDNSIIKGLQLV